jgi:hypothetical protein
MLSEILQGCFSKIGNLSSQNIYQMAIQEQMNKEKERGEGKVTNVKLKDFVIYLTDGFEYLEIHPSQLLHDAVKSSCLLQHAFRNLARMLFKNWKFVLSNYISDGSSRTD